MTMGHTNKLTRRLSVLALGLIVLIVISASVATVVARGNDPDSQLPTGPGWSVGTDGLRVKASPETARRLDDGPTSPELYLFGTRAGRAFYRVGASSSNCFATGDAGSTGTVDLIKCFTAAAPLMDFSVGGIEADSRSKVRLVRVEGIAVDNVATVALTDEQGAIIARSSTGQNIYSIALPTSGEATRLIALDGAGNEVFSRSFGAPASP